MKRVIGDKIKYYPLTHAQKRIYYDDIRYPGSPWANIGFLVRYKEELDFKLLEQAINIAILKNDGLRLKLMQFDYEPEPSQYISEYKEISLDFVDFSGLDSERRVREWVEKTTSKPFQLIDGNLFYFAYIKLDQNESGYYFKVHHTAADGWSCFLLFTEINDIYEALRDGTTVDDTPNPSYIRYIEDEKEYLKSDQLKKDKAFWHNKLLPLPKSVDLSSKKGDISNIKANKLPLTIPAYLRTMMHEYLSTYKASLYNLVLSALSIYISGFTGIDEFVIGGVNHGRSKDIYKKMVGMFVSTLLFKIKIDSNMTFHKLVEETGKDTNEIVKNHQKYPFDRLATELKEITGSEVGFLRNITLIGHTDVKKKKFDYDYFFAGFEPGALLIHVNISNKDKDGLLELEWIYQVEKFSDKDIRRFHQGLINVLTNALSDPGKKISEIDLLDIKEREQLIFEFNKTDIDYSKDKTIHELFEAQVENVPDNMAVVFQDDQLSYCVLDEKVNQLTRVLRGKGVKQDKIVGVMVSRSLEMMVALMAVLKAGGAYVPIDPEYPIERIKFYLQDSNANILLTQQDIIKKFKETGSEIDTIDLFDGSNYSKNNQRLENITTPHNLAYVIYTSGSTGKPKGVMIRHRNAVNFFKGMTDQIDFSPGKIILALTTVSFDIFLLETLLPLTIGLKVVVASEIQQKDPQLLKEALTRNSINLLQATPSRLRLLLSSSSDFDCLKGVKDVLVGGEPFPNDLFEGLKEHYQGNIIDVYGPTETTVWSTLKDLTREEEITIGIPIANTQVYIVDKFMRLQPVGVVGELYIGGDGVARGYLNRPELTSERFIESCFEIPENLDLPYQQIYQTGDLARWLPDGNIECLGRIDHQVKIRGFRIETGEIENHIKIQSDQSITEAVVMARDDTSGGKFLCAYIVADEKVDIPALENTLSQSLLDYMIPSYFVQVEEIPLTPNGKVDRKKLPDPKIKARGENYTAPRNEIEEKLTEIWAKLLNIKKDVVGIDDNFFKMGGHSLKAAVMITEIHKLFDVKLLMHKIFEMATVRKLAAYIKDESKKEKYVSIKLTEEKEYYLQASAQKRMYFMDQLKKYSILYNIQLMDVYCKGIEKNEVEKAFKRLIKRHESLRTSFHTIEGQAVQRVHEYDKVISGFKVEYWETSEDGMISSNEPGREWTKVTGLPLQDVIEQFVSPFDLSQPPLIRVGLIKIWGDTQILMIDMHHVMSDGISLVLLIKELWALYDREGLPPLSVRYKDYAEWLRCEEQQREVRKQEEFWLNEFSGEIPIINLPYDYPRPAEMTFEGDMLHFEINEDVTQKLNRVAREQGTTLYMVLLAVFNILLAKLSGQEEVIVGTVTAGRGHADLQPIVGMFVDTLAVRNFPGHNKTFRKFLKEVKQRTLSAFENQDYPFEELVGKVAQRQDTSRNPLFDVVFTLDNEAERTEQYLLDVLLLDRSNPYKIQRAKFDMTLMGAETGEEIQFNLEYNTALFKEETIERFISYYKKIVCSVSKDIHKKISGIEIIPAAEKAILLYLFNDTEAEYPKQKTIIELFEEIVSIYPENKAVVGMVHGPWGTQLTYKELNVKVNQLASLLRSKGIKPDDIAAIMVEPSQEMLIGLLSILKAGSAFLPIDYKIPTDRIQYILEESGTRFLLTRNQLLEGISFSGETIQLDNPKIYNGGQGNPRHVNTPGDLAYVIYTSGSTGKPKGVMIMHRTLINLCFWHNKYYSVTSEDCATKYAGFGFDASVWEVFPYLVIGASIYIVPEEIKLDIQKLNRYFEDNGITISFLPTQMCEQFMTVNNTSLRALLTGGDKLKSFTGKNYLLYNNYGPTENTVVATSFLVTEFSSNIPIGKPLHNNQVYIFDKNDYLQPIGVPGELCIGGDSLARGYANNPELTLEKFTANPYPPPVILQLNSYTLYRTGDLVRWLADGNIEFLGRIDYQVKIRGFRIELGEIENQMMHIENIKEAVVIAREDTPGQKYLCAYFVSDKTKDIPSIKETLSKNLPDYMIPSFFLQIERMPLNPSGKIDTKALPAPEVKGIEYAAPADETEKMVAEIWSEVLGMEKVSIDDNFFEIGGDSIKTILISSRLLKRQLIVNVNDFFSNPTIRGLAKHVKKMKRVIDQGIIIGEVELTPIQKWFFESHMLYAHHFNQSVMLYRKEGFDKEIVRKVFTKIVEHHDALRIVYEFEEEKNIVIQKIRGIDGKLFDMDVFQLQKEKIESDVIKLESLRIQGNIDLQNGPLVKLGLFKGAQGDHLLAVIHHLVVDGVSWRALLEDFETGYQQAAQGKNINFQEKTDSFKYWAQKIWEYAKSKELLKELPYWKTIEETELKPLEVGYEVKKEQRKFKNIEILPLALSKEKTEQLLSKVNWSYNTEINDILLTVLGLSIKQWIGIEKVSVTLEGHGREQIFEDANINRTVGWFTTQYPVILDMVESDDLAFTIKNVKETLRRIPNKGTGYGILKFLTPAEKKESLQFKHTPEIAFNYLGEFGGESYNIIDDISGITDLSIGDNISPDFQFGHKVDIEGVTAEGKLKLYFFYNKYEYNRGTIKNLSEILQSKLEDIIDHCVSKEKSELTPSDLGYNRLSIYELENITNYVKTEIDENIKIKLIYPLSPMQSGMLYHSIKDKEGTAYFEQNVMKLSGDIEPSILESSLNQLIERYDILRTIFVYNQLAEPLQIVLKQRKARLYYYEDISNLNDKQQERYLDEFRKKDQERGFEISRDLLIQFSLFKTGLSKHIMVLSFHHILMDGWCLGIVFEELRQIYRSSVSGELLQLEPVIPYVNYIKWLEKQDQDEGLSYWEKYLEAYEEAAILPKFGKAVKEGEYKHEEYHYDIEAELLSRVNKLASDQQVTLNTVCQTIWGLLLQRYNNSNDVVFGAIVSGRPSEIEGVERMVGLFINMIPVRIKSAEQQKFSQILKHIQADSLNSRKHEYLPVAEIQSRTALRGDLIDHIMIYENYPVQEELEKSTRGQGFIVEGMKIYEHTNYDFNVLVVPLKGLYINFSYNALVYDRDIVFNIALHFEKIAKQVVENPDIDIRDLHITTKEEKKQLLFNFNDSKVDYPKDNTIHELFEIQAGKTPGAIAAVFKEKQLGYRELHERTNQLAYLLRKKGVKPDTLSGIMVNRSMEMLVALLGVLKAGGAYVPIDPEYPADRVEYMIKDSNANFLLTQQEVLEKFEESGFDAQVIDLFDESLYLSGTYRDNLDHITSPHHLAYVIYTSGSTGKPKGVTIRHRNAVNFFKGMIDRIDFSPGKTILAVTTLCFDIFLLETLLPVTIGLKLAIADEEQQRDPEGLWEVITKNRVDLVQLTPSRLKLLLSHSNTSYLQNIQDILVGGEAFPWNLFEELKEKYRGNIIDVYGPTETTVWSTTRDLTGQDEINIGTPIANTQIYILDKYKRFQPVGVIGELYIGGDGVSRGYLNRPELTSERFVENPYDILEKLDKPYKEIYNTGDLARWLHDGNIDFLGRVDHQVKIRGFRIETGEIEAQVLKREEVKEAVVITRDDAAGEKFLCAYIVPDHDAIEPGQELSVSALRDYLLQELPDYMVPSYFIIIDRIPLTPNGKVDRKNLVAEGEFLQTGIKYMPPRNEVEEQLIELWQEVLTVEQIGINNNFFELGGNSLKAIQLVSLMVKNFDVKISHIFQYRTVADLAANVLFNKDNIKEKIQEMKRELHPTPEEEKRRNQLQSKLEEERNAYIDRIEQEQIDDLNIKQDYKNILLTGATGYLGAHLVPELLENTEAALYLLVRGVTHEDAQERLKNKLTFYFGEDFFDTHLNRFKVIRGDLREDNLGLDEKTYESLTMEVDAVIHSAANVRHIGQYEEFYEDNVLATQRILEYAKAGKKKDFHFISTLGVCSGKLYNKDYVLYNEYSPDIGQQHENVYARSKFEAEKLVIDFRKEGLNTSIYRVGILVSHSETGKFQENIEENAFYNNVKAFVSLGIISESYYPAEFSFIDYTARAIALLMSRKNIKNEIYHLNNHHLLNWIQLGIFLEDVGIELHVVSQDKFLDYLLENLEHDKSREEVNRFLLSSGFFASMETEHKEIISGVESSRTVKILKQLGFEWPKVYQHHIEKMINHGRKVGFI